MVVSQLKKNNFLQMILMSHRKVFYQLGNGKHKTLRNLASDCCIVIKGLGKGSSVVVWDRVDCILEAEKLLNDKRVYKEVKFNENILAGLVEKSNKIFNSLCSHRLMSESELKYFTNNFKSNQLWEVLAFT